MNVSVTRWLEKVIFHNHFIPYLSAKYYKNTTCHLLNTILQTFEKFIVNLSLIIAIGKMTPWTGLKWT